ncbi:LysR family transcriptional regulator [Amphritea sp.]|uniref:LysR family transcriptional regulator n=1 Tax=Amphritea sp. TaxID=1872502 RepID=UPI003A9318A4
MISHPDENLITKLNRTNLNLMLIFYTLYRNRHLTKTASALCLSQPAVSHSLKKLRLLFDDELFIKTAEGMEPTPTANQIDAAIEKGLFCFDQALSMNSEFNQGSSNREFKIGLADYMNQTVQPYLISHALKHAPNVSFNIVPVKMARIEQSDEILRTNDLDIAIALLEYPPQGKNHEFLFEDRIGCIADSSIYGTGDCISIDDLIGNPHIVMAHREDMPSLINIKLEELSLTRKVIAKSPQIMPLTRILPGTNLITCITETAAKVVCPGTPLKFYSLPFEVNPFKVCLLWDIRKDKDPGIGWLRKLLKDAMQGSTNS